MRRRKRHARDASFMTACGRKIGMCGYTSVPQTDVLALFFSEFLNFLDSQLTKSHNPAGICSWHGNIKILHTQIGLKCIADTGLSPLWSQIVQYLLDLLERNGVN